MRLSSDSQFSDFLDGLGPAQLVGRQTLATPPMGEFLFIRLSVHFAQVVVSPVTLKYYPVLKQQYYPTHVWLMYPWFVPCLGDIQIGMVDKKGALEVEIIRARGLVGKPGSKALPGECGYTFWWGFLRHLKTHHSRLNSICGCFSPAPYVKVYLLENGACIAKKKTKVARKTLDPLYQQQLSFEESPGGKVLQV